MHLHVADFSRGRGMHFRKLHVQPWKIMSVVIQHMPSEYERVTHTIAKVLYTHSWFIHPPEASDCTW